MNTHTANAGQVYFPCGTPDPDDIVAGQVDFDVSVRRELKEETGIDAATLTPEPGWTAVVDGPLISHVKLFRAHEPAEVLRTRALDHIARERQAGALRHSHRARANGFRPRHAALRDGLPGAAF